MKQYALHEVLALYHVPEGLCVPPTLPKLIQGHSDGRNGIGADMVEFPTYLEKAFSKSKESLTGSLGTQLQDADLFLPKL